MEDGVAAVTEAVVTAAAEEDEALEHSPRTGIPLNDKHIIIIKADTLTVQWKLSSVYERSNTVHALTGLSVTFS